MKDKLNIIEYTIGYDKYDEDSENKSIGVKEILNFRDLSYGIYLNGEYKEVKFLTKEEALNKFGYLSESVKNKILNYDNKL